MIASLVPLTGWDIVLRDGSTVHVRPVVPADAAGIRDLFHRLSPEGRRQRFLTACSPNAVGPAELEHNDPATRFSVVAEEGGVMVALASYVRNADDPNRAECAVTVADVFQGRGLGTRLIELLAEVARGVDIAVFTADTLADNRPMLDVFRDSGYPVDLALHDGWYASQLEIAEVEPHEQRHFERARLATAASLRPLFAPRRVAVVGVGRSGGIGAAIFRNLRARFTGDAIPVNPRATACQGVAAYPRLEDIPGTIDLAVIAVPAADVPAAVDSAIAKQVGGVLVISAGFAETGPEGRAAQDRLLQRVREAGIRLIGPNCLGILNTDPAIGLDATFSPVFPPAGSVAMCTQSGALGLAMLDFARQLAVGISSFASIGNKADVSTNDLLQYWHGDVETNLILLYLESFGNPRTFASVARRVSRAKPIVAIKAGRSASGRRAASSHTGAIASSDVIVNGVFDQAGVIRVDTLEEMFDAAALLARQDIPAGPRLGILTNAGGGAILAADAAEAAGLQVPVLQEATVAALAFLPPLASRGNPVDMLASASAHDYERALRVMLADPGIDSVLAIYVPPLVTAPAEVAAALAAAARDVAGKTVAAVFMQAAPAPPELGRIPAYRFPEAATRAMARAAAYGAWRRRPEHAATPPALPLPPECRSVIDRVQARGGGWMGADEVAALLHGAGIPVVRGVTVLDDRAAAAAAQQLGYPVALKAVGATVLHKSDVGGVRLDLRNADEVRAAARAMREALGARLEGFVVQPMVAPGVELLVGSVQDANFGAVVLCSIGGTLVELLRTPIARLAPLSSRDLDDLIDRMPGTELLHGYRGSPPADITALRDLVQRVSLLAAHCPEILEMDLNPVRVFAAGLSVVDARVRIGVPPAHDDRRIAY